MSQQKIVKLSSYYSENELKKLEKQIFFCYPPFEIGDLLGKISEDEDGINIEIIIPSEIKNFKIENNIIKSK